MAYNNVDSKSFGDTVNGVKTDRELKAEELRSRRAAFDAQAKAVKQGLGQQMFVYTFSWAIAAWIVMFAVALVGFPLGYGACIMIVWAIASVISLGVYSGTSAGNNRP